MSKHDKTKKTKQPEPETEEEEDDGDLNDIPCVDCHRRYPLVAGSSNCRCKRDNTLYKYNQEQRRSARAKKI